MQNKTDFMATHHTVDNAEPECSSYDATCVAQGRWGWVGLLRFIAFGLGHNCAVSCGSAACGSRNIKALSSALVRIAPSAPMPGGWVAQSKEAVWVVPLTQLAGSAEATKLGKWWPDATGTVGVAPKPCSWLGGAPKPTGVDLRSHAAG